MRDLGLSAAALVLLFDLGGCAAVASDLHRAEQSYENARYEDALVWLTDLEDDAPSMDPQSRARFYYLRGMTEYRLGHRLEALHYLALAREVAGEQGSGLRPAWRRLMDRTLAELTPRGASHRPPTPSRGRDTHGEEIETPPAAHVVNDDGKL